MSSTSTTQYYGLTQYVGTDKPSFLDNNEAFAAVDADLHAAVAGVESQGETIASLSETVNGLDGDVTNLSNDLDTEKGKITALQDKEVLQDAAIAAAKADALDMVCAYNEEAATSTHAYAIGDYFRYNDVLYKATSAIAIGDTIVPNVNCSATNVSAELLDIIGDIPSGGSAASDVSYDNTSSGLSADDVQEAIDELKSGLLKGINTSNIIINDSVGTPTTHGTYTPTVDCFAIISYKQECVFIINGVTVINTGTDSNNAGRFVTLPIKAGQALEWYGSQYAGAFVTLYRILN